MTMWGTAYPLLVLAAALVGEADTQTTTFSSWTDPVGTCDVFVGLPVCW